MGVDRAMVANPVGCYDPVRVLRTRRTCLLLSEVKIECRPLIALSFAPYPPAVALDHAPHGGKADSDALEFVLAVQALKYVEKLFPVAHVEPHAVVAHEEHRLAVVRSLRSDFDLRLRLSR